MADNTHRYGLRWVGSLSGACYPKPREFLVASAYQATVSAQNVDLNIGDPVSFNVGAPGSGFIELASGAGSPSIFWGVIVGFSNVKVGLPLLGRKFSRLPGGTTWASEQNASKVLVVPFGDNLWEIDVDDKVTATTLAAYRALIDKNCDLTYSRDATNADQPKANPLLDISTASDDTADFRIVDVSRTAMNQDFSGSYVKLIVCGNEIGNAPYVTDPGI